MKRHPCHSHICIFSVAIGSTVMLFERLLSFMVGINMRQRLEWTKGLRETEKEGSQEVDGHKPSIEMEEKMSTHSQQCLTKDFDKMKPIIIIIDCLVQFAPLGSIHIRAYRLIYLKDLSAQQLFPLQPYVQSRPKILKSYLQRTLHFLLH